MPRAANPAARTGHAAHMLGSVVAIAAWVAMVAASDATGQDMPRGETAKACAPRNIGPRRERLSLILKSLSVARGFELRYWTAEDPVVSHGGGTDIEVVKELARHANTMVHYSPVQSCPGQWKIDAVWVLASGKEPMPGRAVAAASQPGAASRTPLPRAHVETPAEREAVQGFLKAHGFVPAQAGPSAAAQASPPASTP